MITIFSVSLAFEMLSTAACYFDVTLCGRVKDELDVRSNLPFDSTVVEHHIKRALLGMLGDVDNNAWYQLAVPIAVNHDARAPC